MSIPLDRLYHFIEDITREVPLERDVIIYRFCPDGSKKIEDLLPLRKDNGWIDSMVSPHLYCHDQEPLNFDLYQAIDPIERQHPQFAALLERNGISIRRTNLRLHPDNIYDRCLLLHSEQRSENLRRYQEHEFVTVYYWSHAIISRDWYRFARFCQQKKSLHRKNFLVYNRAWTGTREYRLKFADRLVDASLVDHCKMTFNPRDSESDIYYGDYEFHHERWQPNNRLEDHYGPNLVPSHYSADFDLFDYEQTNIEVVLETLFDDDRLHLTEKALRPIACGQPFILCATHGSLGYLRSYGFKTFDGLIDESYDLIVDPDERMLAIIQLMSDIAKSTPQQLEELLLEMDAICQHNRRWFFSDQFHDLVVEELRKNLTSGVQEVESTNTSTKWFNQRKFLSSFPEIKRHQLAVRDYRSRQDIVDIVRIARQYRK